MNHLGDTNKMVGETPRTDLEAFFPHESMYQVCDADFTRRLERELNAANGRIELLMSANADVARIAGERDAAEKRIKRLEEAGDALEYASVILEAGEDPNGFEKLLIAQRAWHKAKEAKP